MDLISGYGQAEGEKSQPEAPTEPAVAKAAKGKGGKK